MNGWLGWWVRRKDGGHQLPSGDQLQPRRGESIPLTFLQWFPREESLIRILGELLLNEMYGADALEGCKGWARVVPTLVTLQNQAPQSSHCRGWWWELLLMELSRPLDGAPHTIRSLEACKCPAPPHSAESSEGPSQLYCNYTAFRCLLLPAFAALFLTGVFTEGVV